MAFAMQPTQQGDISMRSIRTSLIAAAALLSSASAASAVGVELALLVDVSGSVDATEYNLQKTGYINAFNDPTIQGFIAATPGGVAVTYIEWSGAAQQAQLVGWTLLTDAASSSAFATAISGTSRAFSGLTAPGSAINFITPQFASNGFNGSRLVIDVSGDGEQNDGASTAAARNAAVAAGITINGIAIGPASLLTWYTNNVIGGPGAFAVGASSFADFEGAIFDKLEREITGTPTPATMALFGLGLVAVGFARRRG
jgi:uncharacterized protein (TIGR03382 family)